MSRIPLATDYKTRTGAPDRDARLKNAYIETRGEQSVVRRRPSGQGGVAVGTGTAQGGIGFNIAGTDYLIGFWGDTMQTYTGGGTSWSSVTYYLQGAHVAVDFQDYWAVDDNSGNDPVSSPNYWSRTFVNPKVRFTPTGTTNTVSLSSSGSTVGNVYTGTTTWVTRNSLNEIIDSGSSTQTQVSTPPNIVDITFNGFMYTAADMASNKAAYAAYGLSFDYPIGYAYYKVYGAFHYVTVPVSGSAYGAPY